MPKGDKKPSGFQILISPKCFKWFLIFLFFVILVLNNNIPLIKWLLELFTRASK
jgi:hypothetical protein